MLRFVKLKESTYEWGDEKRLALLSQQSLVWSNGFSGEARRFLGWIHSGFQTTGAEARVKLVYGGDDRRNIQICFQVEDVESPTKSFFYRSQPVFMTTGLLVWHIPEAMASYTLTTVELAPVNTEDPKEK